MTDLFAFERAWPGTVAAFTARGPHDPAEPGSGYNLGHTARADHGAVEALRARALAELGLDGHELVLSDQIHGTRIATARSADLPSLPRRHGHPYYPEAEALITNKPGLALMLFFADCCPVFYYDERTRSGGIAHCGWRGSVANLAGLTVQALEEAFGSQPQDLQAIVGPCICGKCYEVGEEVVAAVEALDVPDAVTAHAQSKHVDLLGLNQALLRRAGVPAEQITLVESCSRCGDTPMFSFRRDGAGSGRMVGMFALR